MRAKGLAVYAIPVGKEVARSQASQEQDHVWRKRGRGGFKDASRKGTVLVRRVVYSSPDVPVFPSVASRNRRRACLKVGFGFEHAVKQAVNEGLAVEVINRQTR